MPSIFAVTDAGVALEPSAIDAVAAETRSGLTSRPRTLSPWLFYDEAGSRLFEQITQLPEYYLTRTERAIFTLHADEIVTHASHSNGNGLSPTLTLIELGAGTATKTGILLSAAVRRQGAVVYQPVDVSVTALEAATKNIRDNIPGVTIRCQVADYTTQPLPENRLLNTRTLALYIGSSIGNFCPENAAGVLRNLRAQLLPGDQLLLGTDFAPSTHKKVATILAAYNDAAGVTAAFNRNILIRLNRELGANFRPEAFAHRAIWNAAKSRIEMHLVSLAPQRIRIPANSAGGTLNLDFAAGETIHTENSYKFTLTRVESLLASAGFHLTNTWQDAHHYFAVNLATAV